jgi:hypothetical protein
LAWTPENFHIVAKLATDVLNVTCAKSVKSMEKRFQYSMEFHKILFTISIDFHGKFRDGHLTLYKLKPVIIT